MKVLETSLPGVLLIEPVMRVDERGFFFESFHQLRMTEVGVLGPFVQDNHSGSRRGILRGLHYQIRQPQGKLVRVIVGEIFDVAVDLRRSSATLGRWSGARLSAENRLQQWIPVGFAHGFYVLSEWAEVIYKVTDYYAPDTERTLRWDDPDVGVAWPLAAGHPPTVSGKDAGGDRLADADLFD